MLKTLAALGVGVALVLSPLAALAEDAAPAPAEAAKTMPEKPMKAHKTHKSHKHHGHKKPMMKKEEMKPDADKPADAPKN